MEDQEDTPPKLLPSGSTPPLWGSTRLILVILCFFGALFMMVLRFNFSMAIVCMTSGETGGEFDWSKATQGYLLSAFFYGYICTQILGNYEHLTLLF